MKQEYHRHGGRISTFRAIWDRAERVCEWITDHRENETIVARLVELYIQLTLQQFRIDVVQSASRDIDSAHFE